MKWLQNSGMTEGQGKSNIAPTFSKRDYNKKRIMLHHFDCKVGKKACTIFSCIFGHTEEIKMAAALLTAALKTFGRN